MDENYELIRNAWEQVDSELQSLYVKMDATEAVNLRSQIEYLKNKLKEAETKANYYQQLFWDQVGMTEPEKKLAEAQQRIIDEILNPNIAHEED
jgi:hypothetical protein